VTGAAAPAGADAPPPGLLGTILQATFAPRRFFDRPAARRSRVRPLAFAIAVGAPAMALGEALSLLAFKHVSPAACAVVAGALAVVAPILVLLDVALAAGLSHAVLRLAGARRAQLGDTFACVCYSRAPTLFALVPAIGPLLGSVWHLVTMAIGLRRAHATTVGRAVLAVALGPLMAVVLALGLRAFAVEAFKIPGDSMEPAIVAGDHVFVDKLVYRFRAPRRGEVVVFRRQGKAFVKRVVGVGGDTVEQRGGVLWLDGAPVDEGARETIGGRSWQLSPPAAERARDVAPTRVPGGALYLMGDNRDRSFDSRHFGAVPLHDLVGRVGRVWFSSDGEGAVRWSRLGAAVQ
jgi:signal peptidase I